MPILKNSDFLYFRMLPASQMNTGFQWTSQTISSISIVFNVYLLYVYIRCPLSAVKSYKYFFLLTAIQNLIFSITLLLLVPVS